MSMGATLNAEELGKLAEVFRKFPDLVTRNVRMAVKSSLRDIREHAIKHHRYKSRSGAAGLEGAVHDNGSEMNGFPFRGEVFVDLRRAPYALYVHGGTKPHTITPKRRRALRWVSGGDFVFAKRVRHPGTQPDEFLYDALNANIGKAEKRFNDALRDSITEAGL